MATPVTFTVGADAARDYSSLNAWEADMGVGIALDLVVADEIWTVEVYNDAAGGAAIAESPFTIAGTTDATHTITIKAAAGNGAGGAPNDHTTRGSGAPLIDDETKGALHEFTGTFSSMIDAGTNPQYVLFENLQFRSTGNRGGIFKSTMAWRGTWKNLICHSTHSKSGHVAVLHSDTSFTLLVESSLFISNSSDRTSVRLGFGTAKLNGCTVVNVNTGNKARTGVSQDGTTTQIDNTAIFGHPTASSVPNGDYNASDDATTPGINSLDSLVVGSQFVNPVAGAAGDWRLKTGAALDDAGDAATAPVTDIIGQTRGTPPDIGAWELASALTTVIVDARMRAGWEQRVLRDSEARSGWKARTTQDSGLFSGWTLGVQGSTRSLGGWTAQASRDAKAESGWRGRTRRDGETSTGWTASAFRDAGALAGWATRMARDGEIPSGWRVSVDRAAEAAQDWRAKLAKDATLRVEWRGALSVLRDATAAADWTARVGRDQATVSGWTARLAKDTDILSAWVIRAAKDSGLPVAWRGKVLRDARVPVEWTGGIAISRAALVPAEWRGRLERDALANLGARTALSGETTGEAGWTRVLGRDAALRLSSLATVEREAVLPAEWRGGTAVIHNAVVPVGWRGKVERDALVGLGFRTTILRDAEAPADSTARVERDAQVVLDTVLGVVHGSAALAEWRKGTARDAGPRVGWRTRISRDGEASADYVLRALRGAGLPGGWTLEVLSNFTLRVEWTTEGTLTIIDIVDLRGARDLVAALKATRQTTLNLEGDVET